MNEQQLESKILELEILIKMLLQYMLIGTVHPQLVDLLLKYKHNTIDESLVLKYLVIKNDI